MTLGTALLWKDIREDTIFVPNGFGPMQKMSEDLGVPYYEAANTLVMINSTTTSPRSKPTNALRAGSKRRKQPAGSVRNAQQKEATWSGRFL